MRRMPRKSCWRKSENDKLFWQVTLVVNSQRNERKQCVQFSNSVVLFSIYSISKLYANKAIQSYREQLPLSFCQINTVWREVVMLLLQLWEVGGERGGGVGWGGGRAGQVQRYASNVLN